jgi:hypothetical protein
MKKKNRSVPHTIAYYIVEYITFFFCFPHRIKYYLEREGGKTMLYIVITFVLLVGIAYICKIPPR